MTVQDPLPSPSNDTNEGWIRPPQRGSIVNIASQLGVVSRPGASAYCASKAAVIGMTKADAIDYSKDLIRVNAVCPGIVETEMTTSDGIVIEGLRESVNIAPMGRMGNVREIADCVLFLSSYKASFVQGHAMVVDGGYVIN
jgi:NAD(P)-dependent dehydrogenase (short-subunit alcohol dehydrogenase family)